MPANFGDARDTAQIERLLATFGLQFGEKLEFFSLLDRARQHFASWHGTEEGALW